MIRECIFCGSVLVLACLPNVGVYWSRHSRTGLVVLSALQSPPSPPLWNQSLSLPTVASHAYECKQSNSRTKRTRSRSGPLLSVNTTLLAFLKKMEAGSVSQRMQIGTRTDRLHMWTWIFWSFCITQSTAWHDRHIELILIPWYVKEFDLAMLSLFKDIRYVLCCCLSCQVLDCVKCNYVFSICFFFFVFLLCYVLCLVH